MTQPVFWKRIKEEIAIWRVGVLPGIAVITLVMILRLIGSMQSLEWMAFDSFLSLRPREPIDERIVIVGINEDDIRTIGAYPIPDREIAVMLRKLHSLEPRLIGIDIFRDLPVEPGHRELVSTFKEIKKLICIEKVLTEQIDPPPTLPPEKVGFADQITDTDGKLRRSLLLLASTPQAYKSSLSLSLATAYLAHEGISLENGIRDRAALRFGNTELPRVFSNSGGYVRTDAGGVQVLLNFRSGRERFRTITLGDLKTLNFDPNWIRDHIVIIGMTAPSVKDFITTSAITSTKPATGRVYGVEIQAHAVSQIISAVLDSRPLFNTWSDPWEYLWIMIWGILGIAQARLTKSPLKNFLGVGIASTSLILMSYLLLTWGWWVPVTPAMLVLALNGVGLTALYQYDQALQSHINARQVIIERTFETIHNGPLQTLAKALKCVRERNLSPNELLLELEKELEKLNYELRGVYEFLQRKPLSQDNSLYLVRGVELNLQDPIHQVLYQVYSHTLERDFPCFKTLKVTIRTFDPIDDHHLSIEQKQGLCRFLEEALCNVGKHATGVTRLEVTCTEKEGWYTLSIVDDGSGINSSTEGRGTQQFRNLARQLKGKFRRSPVFPQGTLCELCWSKGRHTLHGNYIPRLTWERAINVLTERYWKMTQIQWLHKLFEIKVLIICALIVTLSFTQPVLAAYQPPADLNPPTVFTDSSGVRGGYKAKGRRSLTLLAPVTHVGRTTLLHPTFAWFVPDDQSTPMEFTLYEFDTNHDPIKLVYQYELQSSLGIMKLSLPQNLPGLTVGKRYLWQVETICNRNRPSRNLLARAEIEVVQMPPALETALSDKRHPSQKATLYAKAGIWYDALGEALEIMNYELKPVTH